MRRPKLWIERVVHLARQNLLELTEHHTEPSRCSAWLRTYIRAKPSPMIGRCVNYAEVLENRGGIVWLGGRDSNPDTVVQSHVSYRWTTSQCGITETG